jgi:hypothetical protein
LKTLRNQNFLRDLFLIEAGMSGWFVYDNIHSRDNVFFVFAGVFLLCLILTGLLSLRKKQETKPSHKEKTSTWAWLTGGVLITLLVLFFFLGRGELLGNRSFRLFLLVSMAGTLAWLFGTLLGKGSPYIYFAGFLLLGGVLYRVGVFVPQVQATPFALGWSEGSRYYAASAFSSLKIYGVKIPWTIMDPPAALLQSVPFFLWPENVLMHRIWLVFLWIGLTAWMSWLFARRIRAKLEIAPFWIFLFFFLFFFQGAVYFHLIPVVILVLLGYKPGAHVRNLLFLVLASFWAGLSRINWLPVPGLLLTTLYLLDTPMRKTQVWRYLLPPFLWTLFAMALGVLFKNGYIALSGEASEYFNSPLTSTLLWYRLLPNATYVPGIFLAITLLCLPFLVMLFQTWKTYLKEKLNTWRWVGIVIILGVFLLGGMVVSTKIGGGADLHNLDAFIVLFGLVGTSMLAGAFAPENSAQRVKPILKHNFWLVGSVLILVFFAFQFAPSWDFAASGHADIELGKLNQALRIIEKDNGKVLFISNRQLQTFHAVPQFELIQDYEKSFLMEMAMSKNQGYLQKFRADLASGKISAVLVDQLNTEHQDESHSFGEENNAWVDEVLLPLLEYYQPAYIVDNGNVNLLVNKNAPDLIEALKTLQK